MVRDELEKIGVEVVLKAYVSRGDKDRNSPLYKISKVGVFVDELNEKILSGEIDAAIHSAKDIPSNINETLEISAVLKRGAVEDVLVSEESLDSIPKDSIIGTSSVRRMFELKSIRKDLVVKDIRGNIDTRIEKLHARQYDGIIIARAAAERFSIPEKYHVLDKGSFLPSANQGIIAIVSRKGDKIKESLAKINNPTTYSNMINERAIVEGLKLGCSMPVAVLCEKTGERFSIETRFYSLNGSEFRSYERTFLAKEELKEFIDFIKADIPASYGYGFR